MTFKEAYCAVHGCSPEQFERQVFSRTLHRRARLLAMVLRSIDSNFFRIDFELIRWVGQAATERQLHDQLQDYRSDPRNLIWLRRCARFRVSTQRLRRLVHQTWKRAAPPEL